MNLLVKMATGGQYIFILEALAQCLPLWLFWPILVEPYWSFIDNSAAQWALTKGYSRNDEANIIVTLFDAAAVAKRAGPWFERVAPAANISDEVSRMDFRRAVEHD